MKINKSKELTITVTEEEACSIVYAIRRLNFDKPNVSTGVFTHDALFQTACSLEEQFEDALESPLRK